MRQLLIVTYDLAEAGRNREALLHKIKSYPGWARLGGSAYLVYAESSPVEVRDNLGKALDVGDKLYVGVASPPSAWKGMPEEVSNWIHANQKGGSDRR